MQQWNDFITWVGSDDGWRIVSTAILPFIAIVLAGLIAALIGRNSTKRVLDYQVRSIQATAVAALIEAGRSSSKWSSLMSGQQSHAESEFIAADIRLRLLPLTGAAAAADWASHEVVGMRKNSAGFSFQADQSFVEYRDRLLEWQRHPNRARKLFAADLERFRFEDAEADAELVEQQRLWAAGEAAAAAEPPASTLAVALAAAPPPAFTPAPSSFAATPTEAIAQPEENKSAENRPEDNELPENELTENEPTTLVIPDAEVPEPVAAPDHVNAASVEHDDEIVERTHEEPEQPFIEPGHHFQQPQQTFLETEQPFIEPESSPDPVVVEPEPEAFHEEDRNEDDPIPESQKDDAAATQALPLSYFDPVPQRPLFPVRRDDDQA